MIVTLETQLIFSVFLANACTIFDIMRLKASDAGNERCSLDILLLSFFLVT
jgi:hypothetical protein